MWPWRCAACRSSCKLQASPCSPCWSAFLCTGPGERRRERRANHQPRHWPLDAMARCRGRCSCDLALAVFNLPGQPGATLPPTIVAVGQGHPPGTDGRTSSISRRCPCSSVTAVTGDFLVARLRRWGVIAIAVACALLVVAPIEAEAHAFLVRSSPAAGQRVLISPHVLQ